MFEHLLNNISFVLARIFPRSRFLSFVSIVILISTIIHTGFYIKLIGWIKVFFSNKRKRKIAVITASVLVIYLLIPVFFRQYFRYNPVKISWLQYYVLNYPSIFYQFVVLAYTFVMIFYLPVKYLYRMFLWVMEKIKKKQLEKIRFTPQWKIRLKKAGIILPLVLVIIWFYGNIRFVYFQKITKPVFSSSTVPAGLNGLRILQVSDIHVGIHFRKKDMEKLVRLINAQSVDMVVFTGDLIDNNNVYLPELIDVLKKLRKPRYGIYFCLGNHDFYAGYNRIAQEIKKIGFIVLRNNHKIIQINNKRLAIVGLEDLSTGDEDVDQAFHGIDADFSLLLVHQPYRFKNYAAKGVNLVLCGHTHGGQIVIAKFGRRYITPAAIASPYVSGFYHYKKSAMYVNRGYGVAFFPLRINCDPEIAIISLQTH